MRAVTGSIERKKKIRREEGKCVVAVVVVMILSWNLLAERAAEKRRSFAVSGRAVSVV